MNPNHAPLDMKKMHGECNDAGVIAHQGASMFMNAPMSLEPIMDVPQPPGIPKGSLTKGIVPMNQQDLGD